jgi:hypothetical protein
VLVNIFERIPDVMSLCILSKSLPLDLLQVFHSIGCEIRYVQDPLYDVFFPKHKIKIVIIPAELMQSSDQNESCVYKQHLQKR